MLAGKRGPNEVQAKGRIDPFNLTTAGILGVVVIYLLLLLFSQVPYLNHSVLLESLRDEEIWFAVSLSLKTSVAASCLAVFLGTPVAYLLSRNDFPGKAFIDTLLDLPTILSPVALGAIMLIFFNQPPGLWIQENIGPVVFSAAGIVVAQTTITLAIAVRLIKAVFDAIDPYYEIAARVLGESRLGAFRRVTLPMARQGIISAFILAWARALGEFGATVTLAGATKYKTETLPIAIYLNLANVKIEKAVVTIWILLLMSYLVLLLVRYLNRKKGVYL
ncbi:ABC-type sulfate transport system, permease component [Pelotomaculum thermopropionicum SI]|uniref:ABC-type sulfate transport system, permease component n=1 Tax=Pelotomaculum thermopropionicum (strain DSM 13744 / JCM 10971 / SI) TaxID=370438 RepID=A5D419_PELTS|nr:ABC-type sulfate transport system, permease component [Pelotomaculum thermopropionicum SI]